MSLGIYCYIDTKDDSIVYVGKDSNIDKERRNKEHYQSSKYNNQQINRILQNNPNRYTYQVLAWNVTDQDTLNALEISYICNLKPKFNFTAGGDGMIGYKHSNESKQKMSDSHKGKKLSNEHKQKISNGNRGKKVSEETKKKLSDNNARYWLGKTRSFKTRKKMSENSAKIWQGKSLPEEVKQKLSEANKGKIPWNKGKNGIYSEETLKKMKKSSQLFYPTIIKDGYAAGTKKQVYAIYFHGNRLKTSIHKDKLERYLEEHIEEILIDSINNELMDENNHSQLK